MIEIIPSWHPIFVHFTVGLLSMSVLVYLGSIFLKSKQTKKNAETVALWMLWIGAGFALVTVATGFYAFATVAHDDLSHLAMKDHRNWALGAASLFVVLAGWSFLSVRKGKKLPAVFPVLLVAGGLLLGVVGYKGAELVYRHGLGVMSLPKTTGDGHDHDHSAAAENGEAQKVVEAVDKGEAPDLSTPEGTVDAFHRALEAGDGAAALALFDPGVLIYESGFAERSTAEYQGHHLPADMAFSQAMARQVTARQVRVEGDAAVVTSETRTKGAFRDKEYDLRGTETMVLRRDGEGWRITHIHWSSSPAGD